MFTYILLRAWPINCTRTCISLHVCVRADGSHGVNHTRSRRQVLLRCHSRLGVIHELLVHAGSCEWLSFLEHRRELGLRLSEHMLLPRMKAGIPWYVSLPLLTIAQVL